MKLLCRLGAMKGRYHPLTAAVVIERSRAKHGDRYTYDNLGFTSTARDITVTCSKHGDFKVLPQTHWRNASGCQKCWAEQDSKKYLEVDRYYAARDLQYPYPVRTEGSPCRRGHMVTRWPDGKCRQCTVMMQRRRQWAKYGEDGPELRIDRDERIDSKKIARHKEITGLMATWTI